MKHPRTCRGLSAITAVTATTVTAVCCVAAALPASGHTLASDAGDGVGVGVSVTIDPPELEPGVLALSYSTDPVELVGPAEANERLKYTGALPVVSVIDTRSPEEVTPGASWAVLVSVSDFESGADSFSGSHLGWTPFVVGDGGHPGLVLAGPQVDTELDGGPGLQHQELLGWSTDARETVAGTYSVGATLRLVLPQDTEPGQYTGHLTLSLFE